MIGKNVRVRYMPVPGPSVEGRKVVGLDTWVWRRLASAARRGDEVELMALEALQDAVDGGSIVVPLAPTTYHEVQGITDFAIRDAIARLAARLSGWHTFESPTRVLEREIDCALNKLFGTPIDPPNSRGIIGSGVHYMFLGVSHALRLVGDPAEIADFLEKRGDTGTTFLREVEEYGQLNMLRGPSPGQDKTLRDVHGYAPEKTWAVSMERAERYKSVAAALAANPDLGSRPADLVNAAEIGVEIGEIIAQRMHLAGLNVETWVNGGREHMTELLDLLPGSVVRRAILVRVLRDKNRPPTPNDVSDADLYATLVPQSDLVVAEKAVHRALSGSKIIAGYDVVLEKKLSAVPQALAALIGSSR